MKAKTVTSINYIGYNYMDREDSIMNEVNYEKDKKKAWDVLEQFDKLYTTIKKEKQIDKKYKVLYNSFVANGVIRKLHDLKNKDFDEYYKEIRKKRIIDLLLENTFARKIKKFCIKHFIKLYMKVIK